MSPPALSKSVKAKEPVVAVVAHEDDDLLFLSPTLLHYLSSGQPVRIVYLTAGDAGKGLAYWQMRELGVREAYDVVLGKNKGWKARPISAGGRLWTRFIFPNKKKKLELVFLRLPDGNIDGSGYTVHQGTSLQKLWQGKSSSILPIDQDVSLSRAELVATLASLQEEFGQSSPTIVLHTLNCEDAPEKVHDHSDHHFAAMFALAGQQQIQNARTVYLHWGYNSLQYSENLSQAQSVEKWKSFGAYAADDTDLNRVLPSWRKKSLYQKMRQREFAWQGDVQSFTLTQALCTSADRPSQAP